jgi:MFS family permease
MLSAGVANVTLPWLVLDAGGSATAAALVFTAGVVPYLVFGLPAGLVGDRFPRRLVMTIAHAGQAAIALAIPLWGAFGTPPVALILLVAALIGLGRVFGDAAAFGAISAIAGRRHFTEAQATLSAAWAVGMVTGPALGGALIGAVGASTTLVVQVVAFGLSAVLLFVLRTPLDVARPEVKETPFDALREGLRVIARDPVIRSFTWMSGLLTVVAMGTNALIVPLLREELGLSSRQAGLILAVAAGSGLFTAVLVPRLAGRLGGPRLCSLLIFAVACGALGLALADGFWMALTFYPVSALAFGMMVATWIGERQKRAPEHLQARVGVSGRMVNMTGSGIGSAIAAGLAGGIGLSATYLTIAIAVAALGVVMTPLLLRANRLALAHAK